MYKESEVVEAAVGLVCTTVGENRHFCFELNQNRMIGEEMMQNWRQSCERPGMGGDVTP